MVMIPETVKELIEYLKTYPDDMEVYIEDENGDIYSFSVSAASVPLYRGDDLKVLLLSSTYRDIPQKGKLTFDPSID